MQRTFSLILKDLIRPSREALSLTRSLFRLLAGVFFLFTLASCSSKKPELVPIAPPAKPDVLIYGATPGGITAAIAAKESGKSPLIIEPTQNIGGIITGGLGFTDVCLPEYFGGLTREYFERIGSKYGKTLQWKLEPHIGEQVFYEIVNDKKIPIQLGRRIVGLNVSNGTIKRAVLDNGQEIDAKVFIDASYPGDLLNLSGVSFHIGREGAQVYNESMAGFTGRVMRNQFEVKLSAYRPDGSLYPGIVKKPLPKIGTGDGQVMAFNYRPCLTKIKSNKREILRPRGYDASYFDLMAEYFKARPGLDIKDVLALHETIRGKIDLNTKGPFSTDFLNKASSYIEASHEERERIADEHLHYTKSLLYFLKTDARVPDNIRNAMAEYGLCRDEFVNSNNWPELLYVRVGRRLVGEYVVSQKDLMGANRKPDSIGWGTCRIEVHHNQRLVDSDGNVFNEGIVAFRNKPYQIPYRSITPKRSEVRNLLVPVATSASNVAYSSLRMEPVFMTLGEAAGIAASMAIDDASTGEVFVQGINIENLQNTLRRRKQRID